MSLADSIIEEQDSQVIGYLRAGANVNQLDEYGFTPLIEAAIADNLKIAKYLLDYGANPNLPDMTGGTALHWAAENNNISLCQLLLDKGANPNAYTFAGQPVLVMPLLRQQMMLKNLLLRRGAYLEFAQDYINAKLLGHMFELIGTADIVDPNNNYVEVDFEGFYLEFTLSIIAESLSQFQGHFAARELRRYSRFISVIVDVINRAAQLIKYQQYRVDIEKYDSIINELIQQEPLIIPVGYEGHAITFVKYGNILVKCDRREESRLYDNVVFYQIMRQHVYSIDLVKNIIYEKQSADVINNELPNLLDLQPITELKIPAQISGNCSFANVEACIPVVLLLLFSQIDGFQKDIPRYKSIVLNFFQQWREWNKTRALNFCIQSFKDADSIRRACKAEILVAILFQSCKEGSENDKQRIETILDLLSQSKYHYVLQNYIKTYYYEDRSEEGQKFYQLLKDYGKV
jgi:hypothetical protein